MNIEIIGQGYASSAEDEELKRNISPRLLRRMPSYARIGVNAAIKALKSAALFPAPEDTTLIIGSHFGPQCESFNYMDSIIQDGPRFSMPMSFANSVNNSACGLISQALNIKGPTFTINNEEQSFVNAMQIGLTLINCGRVSVCLVGSLDEADNRLRKLVNSAPHTGAYFLVLRNANF